MLLMTDTTHTIEIAPGIPMPMVGFGTWQITGEQAYTATRAALEAGYRHLDTATMYRNEAEVGRALADSGVSRDDVFVTTKLPPNRFGQVRATIEESLRALRVDRVDLWLIHWPANGDPGVAVWAQLREVREAGLARAIGVSNYEVDQIDALIEATGEAPAVNQISWTPRLFDAEVLEGNLARGVVVEGYSGLRGADLRDPVLVEIASGHGVTPAQVVLRWHLEHGVVVIPKSVHEARIRENLDLYGFALTPEETARIDAMAR